MQILRHGYLTGRFFLVLGGISILFMLSFPFTILFPLAQTLLVVFAAILFVDVIMLFNKSINVTASRKLAKLLSLGSDNSIDLQIINKSRIKLNVKVIDEIPYQFQVRDFSFRIVLKPDDFIDHQYTLKPTSRGKYKFGDILFFLSSNIGLIERRIRYAQENIVPVYPSIIDMNKFELISTSSTAYSYGVKRIRKIGQSQEFDQIREYGTGDNFNDINWKATSRSGKLMINQYTDEKAQSVYCILDKSRHMKLPFNDMNLLDYAINASLVIANTTLNKQDKAGLISFSDRVESFVMADRKRHQLKMILDSLYNEKEAKLEANYEQMYGVVSKRLQGRSLLFLFANFESSYGLERSLKSLRKLNQYHLLVVIVFKNTELVSYYEEPASDLRDVYNKTIAQKSVVDKEIVLKELANYGIQTIFTTPEDLSVNTLNKYLELKSRGMI